MIYHVRFNEQGNQISYTEDITGLEDLYSDGYIKDFDPLTHCCVLENGVVTLESCDRQRIELTPQEIAIRNEKDLIERRRIDGIDAYQQTQAELRLSRLQSGVDHAVFNSQVYEPMNMVITSIMAGSWLDAYDYCVQVQTNAVLSQSMRVSFLIRLGTYLCESGNYPEFNNNTINQTTGEIE